MKIIKLSLLCLLANVVSLRADGQSAQGMLPLNPARVPAEIRTIPDGRAILLYRDAFRGYAPAGASAIELRDTTGAVAWDRHPGLDIPDATIVTLLDAAMTTAGQMVVSLVAARPGAGTVHLLAYYSINNRQATRLVVIPVACFRLTAAAEGGVWCLGPHVERHNQRRSDFQFVHQFTEDGRLSTSIGDRNAFPGSPPPWAGQSQLVVSQGRVVVWMANRRQIAIFGANGEVLTLANVPDASLVSNERNEIVLADDGSLRLLGITQRPSDHIASWRRSLLVWRPETNDWRATTLDGLSLAIRLVGSTADTVTLWDRDQPRLLRIKP